MYCMYVYVCIIMCMYDMCICVCKWMCVYVCHVININVFYLNTYISTNHVRLKRAIKLQILNIHGILSLTISRIFYPNFPICLHVCMLVCIYHVFIYMHIFVFLISAINIQGINYIFFCSWFSKNIFTYIFNTNETLFRKQLFATT